MPPDNLKSDQFLELVDKIDKATNILVTVSDSPSVDQLAACIGLTIALNKEDKHATAVFSGRIPSTLEFLEPERTIETNTNSLRDFIISLDKSKADKLRYKVEDEYVKIFITPYRTSIDQDDLNFSEGDFNVDLIITLGVHDKTHLDGAIMAHGRILHDATVASLTTDVASEIGSINWVETSASSLSEMVNDLILKINKELIDSQIATALLTGLVAETDRFGNSKATPHTMAMSGILMAAGASHQLIASKLDPPTAEEAAEEEHEDTIPAVVEDTKPDDGSIRIEHQEPVPPTDIPEMPPLPPQPIQQPPLPPLPPEAAATPPEPEIEAISRIEAQKSLVFEPPEMGGQLTANTLPEDNQYLTGADLFGGGSQTGLLKRSPPPVYPLGQQPVAPPLPPADPMPQPAPQVLQSLPAPVEPVPAPPAPPEPVLSPPLPPPAPDPAPMPAPEPATQPIAPPLQPEPFDTVTKQTLEDIERSVGSIHLQQPEEPILPPQPSSSVPPPPPIEDAQAAVERAARLSEDTIPEPLKAVGASPVHINIGHEELDLSTLDPPAMAAQTAPPEPPPVVSSEKPPSVPPPIA
jgi:hypothetical protein